MTYETCHYQKLLRYGAGLVCVTRVTIKEKLQTNEYINLRRP